MNIVKNIVIGLKGFFMGAANVVPGVSGGTIALVSGIYEELIEALNAVMSPANWKALFKGKVREFWQGIHGNFLFWLLLGTALSIFSLAKLVERGLARNPILIWAFFFGLILASVFFMLRDIKGWKWKDVLVTVIGVALGFVVCTLSPTETTEDMWFIFVCGAIAICTMILPGISGSFILVILGKYDYIMAAVSSMNIPVLAVFAVGCAVGILAFAKFLHWVLGRWERQTMLVLVGFVIGSLVKVWPWADMDSCAKAQLLRTDLMPEALAGTDSAAGAFDLLTEMGETFDPQTVGAVICCVVGLILIVAIEKLSAQKKAQ